MAAGKGSLDELRIDRSARPPTPSRLWVLFPLAAAGIAVACYVLLFARPSPVEVRTATVLESGAISDIRTVLNASGYVVARREATVSSKVTGKVVEILVEEGMGVGEGQVLARLDASNVHANLDLAEAQLESARSTLAETEVRLEEADRELERVSNLARAAVSSEAELDRARAEARSLEARLDRQHVEIEVAGRQVALWKQQLEDTIIRAPFAGVVTSKDAQPGEMISPVSAGGGFTRTGICTIVDMNSLEIEIDVNESYIHRVAEGQPVEATLDAYLEWKIPCRVIAIVPTADRQKATVKVRVGFQELDERILPQMGVKVAFHSAEMDKQAVSSTRSIPAVAVRREGDRTVVFVIRNGTAERRAVRLGSERNNAVLVLSGLAAGERVIVEPPTDLVDGARVKEVKP